jgi:D-glycero-alpha-D-manno-heptose-7-phosphate kinase
MVTMAGAFFEMLKIPHDPVKVAEYAFDAERKYLMFPGGKQDQFAAAFGGVNYMEFEEGSVVVKPIVLDKKNSFKLENNLLLYYTGINRESSFIIREQMENVIHQHQPSISAMHALKQQSKLMYEALIAGNIDEIGPLLDLGFTHKRKMAAEISNPMIEEIYAAAINAGATGGKISGAGRRRIHDILLSGKQPANGLRSFA